MQHLKVVWDTLYGIWQSDFRNWWMLMSLTLDTNTIPMGCFNGFITWTQNSFWGPTDTTLSVSFNGYLDSGWLHSLQTTYSRSSDGHAWSYLWLCAVFNSPNLSSMGGFIWALLFNVDHYQWGYTSDGLSWNFSHYVPGYASISQTIRVY